MFDLAGLIQNRQPNCHHAWKNATVSYLAVARTGSETIHVSIGRNAPHNHDCRLKDLERFGARYVFVSLRDPVARISSGVRRRREGHNGGKKANDDFNDAFPGEHALRNYVDALRFPSHPSHSRALSVTYGPIRQSFMLPINEYYLARARNTSRVLFVCTDRLVDDFNNQASANGLSVRATNVTYHRSNSFVHALTTDQIAWVRYVCCRLCVIDALYALIGLVCRHFPLRFACTTTGRRIADVDSALRERGSRLPEWNTFNL